MRPFKSCTCVVSLLMVLSSLLILRADVVIFSDTFFSEQQGALTRDGQSGEVSDVDYLVVSRGSGSDVIPVYLSDRGLVIENRSATFVSVTPDLDFSQAGSDGFRISVDITPEPGSVAYSPDRWAQIHFGGDKPNRFVWAQGFGILVRSDPKRGDGYQIFHNGQNVASGRLAASETYRFDIVVENGDLAFTVNGDLQSPFENGSATYSVGPLRLGYVSVGSHQAGDNEMVSIFGNLSLERLEVESGSMLILSSISLSPASPRPFVTR